MDMSSRRCLTGAFILLILAALLVPACAQEATAGEAEPLVYSRYIDVPGVGEWYYYAQNDPEWNRSYYEPKNAEVLRRFGSGGCGPTSLAIALSRVLTPEEMTALHEHRNPQSVAFGYCACSVSTHHCSSNHEILRVRTPEEFLHNMPRVLGCYATGGNDMYKKYRGEFAGTSLAIFEDVAEDYGLDYWGTSDWEKASAALARGAGVITTVTKGIFTGSSHYMAVAGEHEGYIYILDPLMRTEYELDVQHVLTVVEPGLVRASMDDFDKLELYGYYIIERPAETQEESAE
ncbi:MAG: C39 family peptidase [Clostridia bacterium]|nr:C39 family peptidase [Clostridia bacterium]